MVWGVCLSASRGCLIRQRCGTIRRRTRGWTRRRSGLGGVPECITRLPDQATLRHNKAEDPRLDPAAARARLGAAELRVGDQALFLGKTHFGCLATVLPDVSRGLSKQARPPYLPLVPFNVLRRLFYCLVHAVLHGSAGLTWRFDHGGGSTTPCMCGL